MKTYYAYIHTLKDSGTDKVFYVGKGSGGRAFDFFNSRNAEYLEKTHGKSFGDIGVGVMECSSERIAFALESGLIKCLRRAGVPLTNTNLYGRYKGIAPPENKKGAYEKRIQCPNIRVCSVYMP